MNQKQAKRLRRIEQDITALHNAHYATAVRIARIDAQLYNKPKLPAWRRYLYKLLHKSGR